MEIILMKNVFLTKVISVFIVFLELIIYKIFLVHIFNLHFSKIKSILFLSFCFLLEVLTIILFPIVVLPIITIFITFIGISLLFKIGFTQKMFILVIPLTFFQLITSAFVFAISYFSNISPLTLINIPIVRPLIVLPTYFIMFVLLDYLKKMNFSKSFSFELDFSSKLIINTFSICTFISVLMNYNFIYAYSVKNAVIVFIISNLFLIALLVTLVIKIFDLKYAENTIDYEKKSYNFLSNSYDCVRGFKHDFSNIMQAIGGYILTDDLPGLKEYYSSVFKDCSELHKLSIFNKDVLNSPPVLSIIAEKYYKAADLGIEFNIDVFIDLNDLNMDIYEFTRILGIFLDNSIEAASQSSKKVINIMISKDFRNHFDLITVENSCNLNSIDTNKIFEKNFSTKPKNTGLGLWKVKNILKKYDNISLNTSVNNNFFRHQLKIYY